MILSATGCHTDTLSNTAQVLTSIVDTISEQGPALQNPDQPSLLLQEALELFARCLNNQEASFADFQRQLHVAENVSAASTSDGNATSGQAATSENSLDEGGDNVQEQWATVMVPVSKSTILDTILAQLATITTLYSLLLNDKLIPSIMEYAQPLVVEKVPFYVTETGQDLEAAIAVAGYASAEADAKFRFMGLSMGDYSTAVQQVSKVTLTQSSKAQEYLQMSSFLWMIERFTDLNFSRHGKESS